MIRRTELRPVGTRMKEWRRTHVTQEPKILLPDTGAIQTPASSQQEETLLLPAVVQVVSQTRHKAIEYRCVDRPLQMLYGAYVECLERTGKHPEALFISRQKLTALEIQTRTVTERAYDGFYRAYRGGSRADIIPIYTDADQIPPTLKMTTIPLDCVVAVCDPL